MLRNRARDRSFYVLDFWVKEIKSKSEGEEIEWKSVVAVRCNGKFNTLHILL